MRLSVFYFEVAARRATEAAAGAEGEEARRVADAFARLAVFTRDQEDAEIAALLPRARRKADRQRRKS